MRYVLRSALLASVLLAVVPAVALAAVRPGTPFPSNLNTVRDRAQLTGLRVALPKPNCTSRPSDCADIDVLNSLDGFSVDPRLSIPFNGKIDVATVSSQSVFLVDVGPNPAKPARIGIDVAVWTDATNTLHARPALYLLQDRPYLLVVTNAVRGADGSHLDTSAFRRLVNGKTSYGRSLRAAIKRAHISLVSVADASLFTTRSITSGLEQIRAQLHAARPNPATFALGPGGSRTVFRFDDVLGVVFNRQVGTNRFTPSTLPAAVPLSPGAIGTVAFGKYSSPDYRAADFAFPAVPTRTGRLTPHSTQDIYFNLWLPSGTPPSGGWPVAIMGHGFGDSKMGAPITVASTMAKAGIATIAINVPGHGGGPQGTLTVLQTSGATTFSAGGRGVDQNGDGNIDSTEGVNAVAPRTLLSNSDGLRQEVVDLMQLVREIEVGVDVDGNGTRDLDPSKITYFGQSFGGIYGSLFMAIEPDVHAGVLNVPGGSISDIARLAPVFRPLVGAALLGRTPSLYNATPNATATNFNENLPLPGAPLLVDTVPGADAIQQYLDWSVWAQTAGDPVAYAPYITFRPLKGVTAKSVIVQFAFGDQTVPNPTAVALIRAGRLESRATLFRNDIAFGGAVPGYTTKNPHAFLTSVTSLPTAFVAVLAQQQIASFLGTNGTSVPDPDGPGPLFETPAAQLPSGLNFIP